MKKLFVVVLILAAVTLSGCVEKPTVKSVEYKWGEVTSEQTEILSYITVNNPNPVPIPLSDVEVEILMNGILMGYGSAIGDTTISASSDDTLILSIKLDNDKLVDWWVSHIENGEKTVMKVKSSLVFSILGYEFKTPPMEQSNTIETSMLSQISIEGASLEVGGVKAIEITRANAKWGDVDKRRTQIVIDAEVKNNMPVPIPVKFLTYTIEMNGIKMGSGKVTSDVVIPPKSKKNIRLVMDLDNTKIPEWWVSHIKNGEKTTISISTKVTVEFMGEEYTFKLFTQNYEFSTNLVGSMR